MYCDIITIVAVIKYIQSLCTYKYDQNYLNQTINFPKIFLCLTYRPINLHFILFKRYLFQIIRQKCFRETKFVLKLFARPGTCDLSNLIERDTIEPRDFSRHQSLFTRHWNVWDQNIYSSPYFFATVRTKIVFTNLVSNFTKKNII